jgi:hypothetical protein
LLQVLSEHCSLAGAIFYPTRFLQCCVVQQRCWDMGYDTALCCICPAAIYMLILLYMFVGVALASDKFMDSIEVCNTRSSTSAAGSRVCHRSG